MIDLLSDPVLHMATSLGLGLLFGAAGVHKLRDRAGFAVVLQSYVAVGLEKPLSVCIPLLELLCALALQLPALRSAAALLAAALLAVYAAVMAASLLQGRRIADCGCQFGKQPLAVSAPLVWRNLLLMLLALALLLPAGDRALGLYDGLVISLALLMGGTFYFLANTLIANRNSARELSL